MANFYSTRTLAIIGVIVFVISTAALFWTLRSRAVAMGTGTHNLIIGFNAAPTMTSQSNCIVIGDNASDPKGSNELVIRFEDGTEFRAALPNGKHVDLRSAFGADQKPIPICWARPTE